MTREDIDNVHIEHRGLNNYWNITMIAVPKLGNSGRVPCYAELVEMAERVLRDSTGLGKEWYTRNAEVMAWSSNTERDVLTPYRYRVSLNMITEEMEDNADAN